jgi:glycosyltransferase involved in cell wall biosynthesis
VPTHLAIMDVTPDKRGSFENYAVQLAARLEEAGWRSVQAFWGPPPSWLREELRQRGAELVVLGEEPEFGGQLALPAGPARDWRMARLLHRLARVLAPDVVHLHFCIIFSILPLALRLGGARNIVATEHISLPFCQRPLPRDLIARVRNGICMRHVQQVLAVSDWVRRRLVQSDHVSPRKVSVLYNGVDLSRFHPGEEPVAVTRERLGIPRDHQVVTCVGQLIDFKGINHLIDAADLLRDRQEVDFLIVGDGDRKQALAEQVRRLELEDRVRLLGKRDDVHDLLRASDLFVCPSVWDEALGYVILEAMAVGVPAVASRVGGIPEVVREGENGLLVEPRNPPALAAAIATLLDDPGRRAAMGREARRVVEESFSMERAIDSTMAVYAELAGMAVPGSALAAGPEAA